jgi:DGQHR domain-containing protein
MDGIKVIRFPSDEGKFAYILDGQHRLEGFKYSDSIEFDLPVVAIYNADDTLRGKIFADINSKQERVSDMHLLSLYYQIKELPADDSSVMDVLNQLNTDTDSPLKQRIRMMDSDKDTWVKNVALKQWLAPHLVTGGVLVQKKIAEKTQIFKEYFKAAAALWPKAWGDLKHYNLCRPMGFEILIGLFSTVKHRCDLNAGKQYTLEGFSSQMSPLLNATIELPGGGKLPVNWERGTMGSVANRTGRTLITKQLADLLRLADEESDS